MSHPKDEMVFKVGSGLTRLAFRGSEQWHFDVCDVEFGISHSTVLLEGITDVSVMPVRNGVEEVVVSRSGAEPQRYLFTPETTASAAADCTLVLFAFCHDPPFTLVDSRVESRRYI